MSQMGDTSSIKGQFIEDKFCYLNQLIPSVIYSKNNLVTVMWHSTVILGLALSIFLVFFQVLSTSMQCFKLLSFSAIFTEAFQKLNPLARWLSLVNQQYHQNTRPHNLLICVL